MSTRTWSPVVQDLGDRIAGLSLAGAAELRRYLEEVYGVAPGASPVLPPVVIVDPEPPSLECDVRLDGHEPPRKIAVLRVVRELCKTGLKEAKELVESVPRTLCACVPRAEAERMKERLEAVGGQVTLV